MKWLVAEISTVAMQITKLDVTTYAEAYTNTQGR